MQGSPNTQGQLLTLFFIRVGSWASSVGKCFCLWRKQPPTNFPYDFNSP